MQTIPALSRDTHKEERKILADFLRSIHRKDAPMARNFWKATKAQFEQPVAA
jgi:hypothetical protein